VFVIRIVIRIIPVDMIIEADAAGLASIDWTIPAVPIFHAQ
jgi:hypothetical protein